MILKLLIVQSVFLIAATAQAPSNKMSFFLTSEGSGNGANLGGLAGADAQCQKLAKAAGSKKKNWHAYLSTQGDKPVNAKDRIGKGPWFNAKGEQVASNIADLHSANNKLSKQGSISEKGAVLNGRGDTPNTHDILTGSTLEGLAFTDGKDHTCKNWTSDGDGSAQVGHHDRQGGGENPTSWNNAHASSGCSQAKLASSGGSGRFYCFAK